MIAQRRTPLSRMIAPLLLGDVQLVLIEGVALYGDKTLMARFWERSDLEELAPVFGRKALASRATGSACPALHPVLGLHCRERE